MVVKFVGVSILDFICICVLIRLGSMKWLFVLIICVLGLM